MAKTPEGKFGGRFTKFANSGEAVQYSNASLNAIQQYRAQVEDAEKFSKFYETCSPEHKKLLDARIVTSANPEDEMRIKCADFVLSTLSTIMHGIKSVANVEKFYDADAKMCQELHDAALKLYKQFPQYFPTEGKV